MSRISVVSLGCPKNFVDSENLLRLFGEEGIQVTPDTAEAEIVLINTCGFIEEAKRESIDEILKLRNIGREGRKLLVFGCLAKRYGEELAREIPEIDALWGVGEEKKIVDYCKKIVKHGSGVAERTAGKTPNSSSQALRIRSALRSVPSYAYLKVAEGCSRGCTFCVIPSIRGPYRSANPDKILERAEAHIKSGVKEIVLVAQDLGSYAREFRGYSLPSLIKDISLIRGEFWIRLLYLYPTSIDDDLLSAIANNNKVCRYLDIPLQHSEDRILKAMGRSGTRKSYARIIGKIRDAIQGVTLRTTFMVGFPGETEKDFSGLKDFVEEVAFERLGVFVYSKEEGTSAALLKGHVPGRIKEQRRKEIMMMQSRISLEKNMALVGRRFRAIVDEVSERAAIARLSSQAPEIDGVVIIENAKVQKFKDSGTTKSKNVRHSDIKASGLKKGGFVNVEISEAYDYDLKGEIIQ